MGELEPEEILTDQPALAHPEDHPQAGGDRVSLARTFGGRSIVRDVAEMILLFLVIFLVLKTTTGRFRVRGSSMEPALQDGQYLVVSKLTYWIHPPERGDIIVFHPPKNPSDDYIKRVVGVPGEQIEIKDGTLWVDGIAVGEPYIVDPSSYSGTWDLKEGEYFVLGDNRRNSSDSHSWGVLPEENVIGKAWLCYWPPEDWKLVQHYAFPKSNGQRD